MAKDSQSTDLVILAYDPATSARTRNLIRSVALSHAARVSHARRRRKSPALRSNEQGDSATRNKKTALAKSSHYRARHHAQVSFPLKLGFLQQGNQDPFDSTAVRIVPDTAHLMSSWREYLEVNQNDSTRWLSDADLERDFSLVRESELNSQCLIFAASSALSARFPRHQGLRSTASRSRLVCLSRLTEIAKTQTELPATTELANCLLLVFIGLCLSERVIEAQAYAGQLSKLLKHPDLWEKPALIPVWCRLYYDDTLFATRYFRPPLLDVHPFVERWRPVFEELRLWELNRLPAPGVVRAPAFSKTIASLFSRLQRQIDVQSRKTLYNSERFDDHHMTGSLCMIFELIYLFFDHWQYSQASVLRTKARSDRLKWQSEETVTLCALAFLANMIAGPKTPDGPDFQECGWRAMQALRNTLEKLPILVSSDPDFWTYQHLQVWAYFLGGTWECDCNFGIEYAWYTARLRSKVQELRIGSWNALKSIVDRYLMVPETYEQGTIWFLGMSQMNRGIHGSDPPWKESSSARLAAMIFV